MYVFIYSWTVENSGVNLFTLAEPSCQMCLFLSRNSAHQQGEQVLVSACREALKDGMEFGIIWEKHFY